MKKRFTGENQISLFGNFEETLSHETLNGTIQHREQREQQIRPETIPGNGIQSNAEQLQSEATVRSDEGTTTGSFFTNADRQEPDTISEQDNGSISQENKGTYHQRNERSRGGRDRVARIDEKSRTDVTLIQNYANKQGFIYGKSFSKPNTYQNNINALQTLLAIEKQQQPATPEQQDILARYSGFGGLKEILLNPLNDAEWKTESDARLRVYVTQVYKAFKALDPDESLGLLQSAKRSILNAHYTSYPIINSIYNAVELAGFKRGNILEPSAGIGNFLAAMPQEMATASNVTAIEMDICSGMILQKLFPTAETMITGFEKTTFLENHYDLVISNIPFGDVPVFDKQLANHRDKSYQEAADNIHNYFFAKSMLLTRPGGLIAVITSRYTLDSTQNKNIRELIHNKAAFLGAIRLPDTAFKSNAGTEVVSDIIFLKKFDLGEKAVQNHSFLNVKSEPFTDVNGVSGMLTYNEYFHEYPLHLLGTKEFGGLYRKDEFNLKGNTQLDLPDAILSVAKKIFTEPVLKPSTMDVNDGRLSSLQKDLSVSLSDYDQIGNLVLTDDGIAGIISAETYVNDALDEKVRSLGITAATIRNNQLSVYEHDRLRENGIDINNFFMKVIEPVRINKTDLPKVKELIALRKLTKELLFKEMNFFADASLELLRQNLYHNYSKFIIRFGNLLNKNNEKILSLDADGFIIQSLEKKNKVTNRIEPADILFKRTVRPLREVNHADNVQDAVTLSLQRYGHIHINYICELMDQTYENLMQSQKGDASFIFRDVDGSYQTREAYLSGNVVEKLAIAKQYAEEDHSFLNNVEQLQKVQPRPIPMVDIYSPLHTRWLPTDDIKSFLSHLLHTDNFNLGFSKSLDTYSLTIYDKTAQSEAFKSARRSAAWVIEHALNGIEPIVKYTDKDAEGREVIIFDPQDTHFAKELYRKARNAWDEFKLLDPERRRNLESIYNKLYNTTVLRNYDGTHLHFPGLTNFTLRPHQKDAVFRNVQLMGGINDHKVGAGKTLVQIATAMELRRLAICNKPMIIGIKAQVPQLYETFRKAYPLSKVLFPSEKDFIKDNRLRLLNNIATNDWDCIILSHDQFNMIRQPLVLQEKIIEELKKEIEDEIWSTDDKALKKKLETQLYRYEQKLASLNNQKKDDKVLDFSQLGIDFLMVDESAEYKNLEFLTKKRNIKGLGNPMASKRAFNMLIACRHLQQLHGADKGILFSSGTPISNTMAEFYLLMKYLRPAYMQKVGLTSFDRWAANFANDYSELEYYMGKFMEVHRFREFTNLPELINMYREVTDVRNDQNLSLDKPKAVHELIKVAPSPVQLDHIEMLQEYINSKGIEYAETLGLTAGYDERRKINPSFAILAINYAKKLSLDPRLINQKLPAGTKLEAAAVNIAGIYHDTTHLKGTQFIFCDLGTPKTKNEVDNLFNFLEGDIPDADLHEIFGEGYHDLTRKPSCESVKEKLVSVLNITYEEASNLVLEANTAGNFNVYNELKRLLVKNGVKEHEVAFVHDYNTRKQKELLYDSINRGEVRITIGSTKKLGTGVNAQQRCVAGHHIDIPWRPSDLEQRNGRFERQGNEIAKQFLDNKVNAFYYATERTLDASMYNTVGLKSHFIAQVKLSANPEVRIAKDIEEDVDMSQMAAELSGDPIFKEKATLSKKITELEQLNRSWLHKRLNTEDNLKQSLRLKEHYENKIFVYENTIPFLKAIPHENGTPTFEGWVDGFCYDKPTSFGQALIREATTKLYKQHGQQFLLGELWGFKIVGAIEQSWGEKYVIRQVLSPDGEKIGMENKLPDGDLAAALQVKNIILGMPEELKGVEKKLSDTVANITEYEKQLKENNPYRTDLLYYQQRLAEVDRIIVKRTEEEKKIKTEKEKIGIAV